MAQLLKTYAPNSTYKNTEEFILPTQGSGVEVAVAWEERVIGDYHFHRKGDITIGSHPSCDIQLPVINSFVEKLKLITLNYGISIDIPVGTKVELVTLDEAGGLHSKGVTGAGQPISLHQKEMLYIYLFDSLKLIIRPSQQSINPRLIPLLDISSDGFLSIALAVAISAIIALLVQLNPTPSGSSDIEDFYSTALIIENPERLAKILKVPPPKVDFRKPEVKPQRETKRPVTATNQSNQTKTPGNKTKPSSLAKNNNKTNEKVGSEFNNGKSIKVSDGRSSQAKSPNLDSSGIFKTFGTAGSAAKLDQNYDGEGVLAGLAKNATNSAGENQNRPGDHFGDRFKQAISTRSGENNVGVEGLQGRDGLGPGLDQQSIGDHKSVAIIPDGRRAVFGGEIDREGIRKVFFDNARALRSCYERALNQNAALGGKFMLDFDIGPSGRVTGQPKISRHMSSFFNADMANCITNRLRTWRFPPPPRNNVVNVLYPLAFSIK